MTHEPKQKARETIAIIREWKYYWMNQRQNSDEDYLNYFNRAYGVDANMMHHLADKIDKEIGTALQEAERKLEVALKDLSKINKIVGAIPFSDQDKWGSVLETVYGIASKYREALAQMDFKND